MNASLHQAASAAPATDRIRHPASSFLCALLLCALCGGGSRVFAFPGAPAFEFDPDTSACRIINHAPTGTIVAASRNRIAGCVVSDDNITGTLARA